MAASPLVEEKPLCLLRSTALKTLIDGCQDGRLFAALQATKEATPETAAPQQSSTTSLDAIRSRAYGTLIKANKEGRLLSALKGSRAKAQAEIAAQTPEAAAKTGNEDSASEAESDKLEQLREVVRNSLTKACRDGRLERALKDRLPKASHQHQAAAEVDMEDIDQLRALARATLTKAGSDGSLQQALASMRTSIASTAEPSSGSNSESDSEETSAPPPPPSLKSLRSSLLSTLMKGAQSGKLQAAIEEQQRSKTTEQEPTLAEIRATAQRSLIESCRNGTLEQALKETMSRTPMPQAAHSLRGESDEQALEAVRNKVELASVTSAEMEQLRAQARTALASALGVDLRLELESPCGAPPPSEMDWSADTSATTLDRDALAERLAGIAQADVEADEMAEACKQARVALARVFGVEAAPADFMDQVHDHDSMPELCLKAQAALTCALEKSEQEAEMQSIKEMAQDALCKALSVEPTKEQDEDEMSAVCEMAKVALCRALNVQMEEDRSDDLQLRFDAQDAVCRALGEPTHQEEMDTQLRFDAQMALCKALDVASPVASQESLRAEAQDALCKALGVQEGEPDEAEMELRHTAQVALCTALGVQMPATAAPSIEEMELEWAREDAREALFKALGVRSPAEEEALACKEEAKLALCKALGVATAETPENTQDEENEDSMGDLRQLARDALCRAFEIPATSPAPTKAAASTAEELRQSVRATLVAASRSGRLQNVLQETKAKKEQEQEQSLAGNASVALRENVRNVLVAASTNGKLAEALLKVREKVAARKAAENTAALRNKCRGIFEAAAREGRLCAALCKVKDQKQEEQSKDSAPTLVSELAETRRASSLSVPEDDAKKPASPLGEASGKPLTLTYQASLPSSEKAATLAAAMSSPTRSKRNRLILGGPAAASTLDLTLDSSAVPPSRPRGEKLRPASPGALLRTPPLSPASAGLRLSPLKLGGSASTPALLTASDLGLSTAAFNRGSPAAAGHVRSAMEEDLGKDATVGRTTSGLASQRSSSLGSLKLTKKSSFGTLPALPSSKASAGSIAWSMNRSRVSRWEGSLGAAPVAGWAM